MVLLVMYMFYQIYVKHTYVHKNDEWHGSDVYV